MDAEEIQNRLGTVSQRAFRSIVGIVLREVFGMQAINVDGSGDGGQDWLVFSSDGRRVQAAIQDTTQINRWEEKALEDAKTALSVHRANRYFFCTNRPHHQTTVTKLEDTIARETGMTTTVIEARRMSELIFENSLQARILDVLGEGSLARLPHAPEIAFWVYSNLSADRTNHRNQIFEDTMICVLHEQRAATRHDLVSRAIDFLGCPVTHRPILDRRVDALFSGRKIKRTDDGSALMLTDETSRKIQETERLYLSDWVALTGAMTSVLGDYDARWNDEQAERGAVLLARLFVLEQLNCLRSAKANLLPGAWQRESGDPQQQLRDLLHECGVQPRKLTEVIGKLIGIAKGRPSISKLTRTAVFAALEGGDPLRSSQALGAARWEDVRILLDASVAIPLLCALRTEPVETYLFALSSRAVDLLHGLGAQLKLSPGHLEECAAHLLRATLYEPIESDPDFSAALKQSENAYVAFYYALRAERRGAPDSLQRFLSVFVRNIVQISQNYGNNTTAVRMVMPDLQGAFSEYSVIVEQSERIPQLRYEAIGKVHDLILAEEGREKSPRLRSHDISALAHLEASFLTKHESWMLLTWDRVVIRVGGSELQGSWVVSPEIAMDFAQPCRRITETQWCSLAHRIARISDPGETLTARILDEIVRLRHELLQDWQFKDELRRFRDEAVQRAPVGEDNRLQAWVEQEASAFIASRQIEPSGEIQTEIEGISTPETEEPIE